MAKTKQDTQPVKSNDETKEVEQSAKNDTVNEVSSDDLIEPIEQEHSLADVTPVHPTSQQLIISKPSIFSIQAKDYNDIGIGAVALILEEMSKDPATGIPNIGIGLMKYQKAKDLGLPWASAIGNMNVIKGKVGIEYQIAEAILSRPKSGVRWKNLEYYTPLYDYMDNTGVTYTEDTIPPNAVKCDTLDDKVPAGKFAIVIAPTMIGTGKDAIFVFRPVDWVTRVEFTRKKQDIDGSWYDVVEIGKFSWRDALRAKLPYSSKTTNIDPDSNWSKRPAFMIWKSAFWEGARRIANDLLHGAYDIDDLNSFAQDIK